MHTVTWKQFIRTLEANARHQQRESAHRHRDLQRRQRELEKRSRELTKQEELERAKNEVELYENYQALLVSLHKEAAPAWDWRAISLAPPPPQPIRLSACESQAHAALANYRPGMFDRVLGKQKRQTAALEADLARARENDEAAYRGALHKYQEEYARWEHRCHLAQRLLQRDASAYPQALEHTAAFRDISEFRASARVSSATQSAIAIECTLALEDVVPTEEFKLTSTGKISTKEIPTSRYWAILQDHVCSVALRIARDTCDILPVDRVIVNASHARTNTATGHRESICVVALHAPRQALSGIRFEHADASDAMKNFDHRMAFKKTTGFGPVEPISIEDQWVSR